MGSKLSRDRLNNHTDLITAAHDELLIQFADMKLDLRNLREKNVSSFYFQNTGRF